MTETARRRRVVGLAVLAAALLLGAVGAAAAAAATQPSRATGLSFVAASRLVDGDIVRLLVDPAIIAGAQRAQLCNTDPAIQPAANACAPAVLPHMRADGRLEFAIPIHTGQIGLDGRALCPAQPEHNAPGARCALVLSARNTTLVAAEIVTADPSGSLQQGVTVVVRREGEEPVTTLGSIGSTTSTTARVIPTAQLPPASFGPAATGLIPAVPAGGGGTTPPSAPSEPLATTGPAMTLALLGVAVLLLDLGYLACTAARPRWRYVT